LQFLQIIQQKMPFKKILGSKIAKKRKNKTIFIDSSLFFIILHFFSAKFHYNSPKKYDLWDFLQKMEIKTDGILI